jgi:hypothetical protein
MLKFMRVGYCAKICRISWTIFCQTVSSKSFLVIKAVDGVDSIMDYLKEVFWRRRCSACTCPKPHQHSTVINFNVKLLLTK